MTAVDRPVVSPASAVDGSRVVAADRCGEERRSFGGRVEGGRKPRRGLLSSASSLLLSPLLLVVLSLQLVPLCSASLDLYLTQWEVRRLLGVSRELFYVRDGVINHYALNFIVPVPAHISHLHFTWHSLTGKPLPYALAIDVSDPAALSTPSTNVSLSGGVPTTPQTFMVVLPCSGTINAEVNVTLRLNVTLSPHESLKNATSLVFKRKKICLKGNMYALPDDGDKRKVAAEDSPTLSTTATANSSAGVFYVAVGCACSLIALVLSGALAVFCVRNKKIRRHGEMLQESRNGSASSQQGHSFLPVESPPPLSIPGAPPLLVLGAGTGSSSMHGAPYHGGGRQQGGSSAPNAPSSCKSSSGGSGCYAPVRPNGHCYQTTSSVATGATADERTRDLHERIADLTIQRSHVRLLSVVLEGTFGRVYRGTYAEPEGNEVEVLVKTVTDQASAVQVSLLLQEGLSLYALSHQHVLSVLGVSIEDWTAPFLIYPYTNYTNLKRFLQKCKLCPEGVAHTLTTQEVVDMALQVLRGMHFLHKKGIVHRDLAARNCVVDEKLRVHITDNALSRDLFPADYHCLGDNENRPVKWLAAESLQHKTFSTASDIWSFGVMLWELTTLAQQPYSEVDPFEMSSFLSEGYRLAQPLNCPDELFAVMAYCWAMSPEERPTFAQLNTCLTEFYNQLTRYV
ncbi:tyrosine-protein kinase Dnt [Hetaerina americana]|uniref:tyrosine-protein kinase Dnt n=1 Tax=Hetaerina americana TaxID=62018 RepID=UPI003A7F10D4